MKEFNFEEGSHLFKDKPETKFISLKEILLEFNISYYIFKSRVKLPRSYKFKKVFTPREAKTIRAAIKKS